MFDDNEVDVSSSSTLALHPSRWCFHQHQNSDWKLQRRALVLLGMEIWTGLAVAERRSNQHILHKIKFSPFHCPF